jgi:hypothetical protein
MYKTKAILENARKDDLLYTTSGGESESFQVLGVNEDCLKTPFPLPQVKS